MGVVSTEHQYYHAVAAAALINSINNSTQELSHGQHYTTGDIIAPS